MFFISLKTITTTKTVIQAKGQDAMFIHPDLYIYICILCFYNYCFTVRNLFTIPIMSEWV